MSMKIRLARGGSKKRPFYRIVAADSRMPRDGRFIEKLGTYNPLLPKDSEDRVKMDMDRIQHWLGHGAQPTDRIARMLEAAGVLPKTERNNPAIKIFFFQSSIVFGSLFLLEKFPVLTASSYMFFLLDILSNINITCSATATAFAVAVIAKVIFFSLDDLRSILSYPCLLYTSDAADE